MDEPVLSTPPSDALAEKPPVAAQIRQAAGIYGLIVTGSVIAAAGGHLRSVALIIAVFVTLIIYWLAEQYAQLGEHMSAGRLPTWAHIRAELALQWPMVSASYIPMLALVVARVLGAKPSSAAYFALSATIILLTWYGWSAGRAASLHGKALALMTALAGGLGIVMVLLKMSLAYLH